MNPVEFVLLALLGLFAGAYGALIGAGGGFVIVPVMLFFYPNLHPATITGISLAVVVLNGLSGTQAYARMKRIDYRTGWQFAALTVPGSVIGALVARSIDRRPFALICGLLIVLIAVYIFFRPTRTGGAWTMLKADVHRRLTDATGKTYEWSYNRAFGLTLSFLIGFLASLLGVGGGIIHVPAMVQFFNFPPVIATATSLFIMILTAFVGTATRVFAGEVNSAWWFVLPLAIGVVTGGQLGARLARRAGGRLIVRLLAVALLLAGSRLLWIALTGS